MKKIILKTPFQTSKSLLFTNRFYNSQSSPAKLNSLFQRSSDKAPDVLNLVVLHGLFGSSNNFQSIVKTHKISSLANSHLLDLRNHGASEHKDSMSLNEMADDIYNFIIEKQIQNNLVLLAHSFGSRIAMNFAMKYPELPAD